MFLGENILGWLLLALGGAMAVGNATALARPPRQRADGDLVRPPVGRSVLYIVLGTVAARWAIASLSG